MVPLKGYLGCSSDGCNDGSKDVIMTTLEVTPASSTDSVRSAVAYLLGYAPADLWTQRTDHTQRPVLSVNIRHHNMCYDAVMAYRRKKRIEPLFLRLLLPLFYYVIKGIKICHSNGAMNTVMIPETPIANELIAPSTLPN